jgi:flagellar export protein FliJ
MSKASRLTPIADYATLREAEAAKRLAASSEQLEAKGAELERLRGYLAEYRRSAAVELGDSARWQNARAFLARLSEAVAFHEAELQKLIERHRLEAERWRESHRRAKTLDKYIERSQREELYELERRKQTELDELASRRHPLRNG